jgi:putative SOS response-associated peptidase YedK
MCGRFTLKTPAKELTRVFGVLGVPELTPRYNIAPTQQVLCFRDEDGATQPAMLRWGLVPPRAPDASIGNRLINARAETVATVAAFRGPFAKRRCLIAADGFYEWQKLDARRRQPWLFRVVDEEPFAFAGLWEAWHGPNGAELETCALITTDANELVAPIHDRMPAILSPERYDLWLDPAVENVRQLEGLLKPYPAAEMAAYPVSLHVNSPKNDGPELIVPVAEGG